MPNQYYGKHFVTVLTYTAIEIVGGKAPLQIVSICADSTWKTGELLNHRENHPNIQP